MWFLSNGNLAFWIGVALACEILLCDLKYFLFFRYELFLLPQVTWRFFHEM